MRIKARKLEAAKHFWLKNHKPGFGKILSNFRADPKIGVAYKIMCNTCRIY